MKARFRAHLDEIPLVSFALESAADVYVQALLFGPRAGELRVLHQVQKGVFRAVHVLDSRVGCGFLAIRILHDL